MPGLWRARVRQDVDTALAHRDAIRAAPDDVSLAIQQARHVQVERGLDRVRLIGHAVIATFFMHDKPRARCNALPEVGDRAGGGDWEWLRQRALRLSDAVRPFHWSIEFPEVFTRHNPGFDAIIGNPPFLGGTLISGHFGKEYLDYLLASQSFAQDRADLVAHFFARALGLLRAGGSLGLIATNTIAQGDTQVALERMLNAHGALISVAIRRHAWPGEAAVVVSVINIVKRPQGPITRLLDGRPVDSISSYLVANVSGARPSSLAANAGLAFEGYAPYGPGFLFADDSSAKNTLADMEELLSAEPHAQQIIYRYVGGSDILQSPTSTSQRFAIFCGQMAEDDFKAGFPLCYELLERQVKPERLASSERVASSPWWQFLWPRPRLTALLTRMPRCIVRPKVASHHAFAYVPKGDLPSNATAVICYSSDAAFATLHSRVHEVWARFFGSSMKDDLRYTPSDCFETFPLPPDFEGVPALDAAGRAYHDHRAALMIERNQGMTPTYNRFHNEAEQADDIAELRRLHHEMDQVVLSAYGWDDLAEHAAPVFLTEENEDDHKYQGRLFWPAAFRDEVLARLLKLNEERAAEERAEAEQRVRTSRR